MECSSEVCLAARQTPTADLAERFVPAIDFAPVSVTKPERALVHLAYGTHEACFLVLSHPFASRLLKRLFLPPRQAIGSALSTFPEMPHQDRETNSRPTP